MQSIQLIKDQLAWKEAGVGLALKFNYKSDVRYLKLATEKES